jgi:hypothetical protein
VRTWSEAFSRQAQTRPFKTRLVPRWLHWLNPYLTGLEWGAWAQVTHVAYDLADWYGHRRIADVLSKWGEADPKDATGASDSTAMSDGFAASSPP